MISAAERLAALVLDADQTDGSGPSVCGYMSERDGAHVVEIDTTEDIGRVRVVINDGPAWGGPRRWKVQSLMTGDTTTYRASSQDDAIAQYLDTVTSNMLVWEVTEGGPSNVH